MVFQFELREGKRRKMEQERREREERERVEREERERQEQLERIRQQEEEELRRRQEEEERKRREERERERQKAEEVVVSAVAAGVSFYLRPPHTHPPTHLRTRYYLNPLLLSVPQIKFSSKRTLNLKRPCTA